MRKAQQGINLSGMTPQTPTVQSHTTPQSTQTCCFSPHLPISRHRDSSPCKASFFSVGEYPIKSLPKVMEKNSLVREIRLSQDRNGWTRGRTICTLWRWWEERVFMVPTPQEGKAPRGHLSTPMKWNDQREQLRKKLIQRLLHICWDPLPQSPWCFFQEIFEGIVGPWGVMMCCQNHLVAPITTTSLHPGHSGHFSVALWSAHFLPFFTFGTEKLFWMFMVWYKTLVLSWYRRAH